MLPLVRLAPLLLTSLVALGGAPLVVPPSLLADTEVAAALRGEVPTRVEAWKSASGRDAGRGVGAIVVARPIDAVWAVVSRYDDKAEYQPRVMKVEILDAAPTRLHVKMTIDASVTTVRYTGWYDLDAAAHVVHWTLDRAAAGNTVADLDGDYHLVAIDEARTLVVYRSFVDTGGSVPRFLSDYFTRRSIPALLRSIQKRVESGGSYRK